MIVTRFAPSPTGLLHIGHAASALFAYEAARREGGRFLLRIEDIDPVRCRAHYVEDIFEDLRWLGLAWEEPVRFQSEHLADYEAALDGLREEGLLYPCFCTRKEIEREAAVSASAPHEEEEGEGPIYPRTCRKLSVAQRKNGRRRGGPCGGLIWNGPFKRLALCVGMIGARLGRGSTGTFWRCGFGQKGCADFLSSERDGGRCASGCDACYARRGFIRRDGHSRSFAKTFGFADARLSSSCSCA